VCRVRSTPRPAVPTTAAAAAAAKMVTSAEDIAAALPPRVRVRPQEDYDSATTPSFPVDYADGGTAEKNRKLTKNPLVPISAAATAAILAGGLFQFKRGNSLWSQRLMRARVVAQGATLALLAGSVYAVQADEKRDATDA
jgi:hypothetical protein